MNVAVIGLGKWGKNLFRVFHKHSIVNWYATNTKSNNYEWARNKYPEIVATTNYKDHINDNSLDAIIIAVPIDNHFQVAKDAINAGKHIFLEKPITSNLSDAEKLVNLVNNKILFVGHMYIYHPCYLKIKEILSYDPALEINMDWKKLGSFDEDIYYNLLSHDISILLNLFGGYPENIIKEKVNPKNRSDIIDFSMILNNEVKCSISINRIHPIKRKEVKILTKSGRQLFWIDNSIIEIDKQNSFSKLIFECTEDILELECKEFLKCINSKIDPISNAKFGQNVIEWIDIIKSS